MRKFVLSKTASKKLDKLLDYLKHNWSDKVKNEFVKKLDKAITQINYFPESCPKSKIEVGLHVKIITKQTSFYYKYDETMIKIVAIFDNRMDPNKLKKEIKKD